jgi:hypothetical protein
LLNRISEPFLSDSIRLTILFQVSSGLSTSLGTAFSHFFLAALVCFFSAFHNSHMNFTLSFIPLAFAEILVQKFLLSWFLEATKSATAFLNQSIASFLVPTSTHSLNSNQAYSSALAREIQSMSSSNFAHSQIVHHLCLIVFIKLSLASFQASPTRILDDTIPLICILTFFSMFFATVLLPLDDIIFAAFSLLVSSTTSLANASLFPSNKLARMSAFKHLPSAIYMYL